MNQQLDTQTVTPAEAPAWRELSAEEVKAVAGGPAIPNTGLAVPVEPPPAD